MDALFEVKLADTLGQSMYQRQQKLDYIDAYRQLYCEVLQEKQCVQKKDLAINGRDLLAMGMKPGKELGDVLDALFEKVLDEPELNTRESLLEQANKLITHLI
jgi:tRNA nucleotidyltransferase (CCA-adding enzyme)